MTLKLISFCITASIGLSVWAIYSDPIINNDGVIYIRTAEILSHLSSAGLKEAYQDFKWPFYSMLIQGVSVLTALTLKDSAHLINIVAYCVVILLFIGIARTLWGRSSRITVLAALVALAHPAFNDYRSFLIRDPAYLAAFLGAFYFLLLCRSDSSWRTRLAAIACLLIGTLFRIESFVFLLFSPVLFALAGGRWAQQRQRLLIISCIGFVSSVGLFLVWSPIPDNHITLVSALQAPHELLRASLTHSLNGVLEKLDLLRVEFLSPYSSRHAHLVLGVLALMTVIGALISELTIPFFLVVLYGCVTCLRNLDVEHRRVLGDRKSVV